MAKRKDSVLSSQMDGAVSMLRLCTVLFAAVSFWSTAQGMSNYVFSQGWQAYAASLAIQGVLLGLNFYLPAFWKMLKSVWLKGGLLILTVMLVVCSSWFSFVFIVEKGYDESWGVESRLLIQSTYRRQLYDADDYAESYGKVLAGSLDRQIMDLYGRAKDMEEKEIDTVEKIDWDVERTAYTEDEFAAGTEMGVIIDAMEIATDEAALPGQQEQAAEVLLEMKSSLEDRSEMLSDEIKQKREDIEAANENYREAQRNLNAGIRNADTSALFRAVETTQQILSDLQEERQDLLAQQSDYQKALSRIRLYEANLKLVSKGTTNLIGASLRNIQQELFQEFPDLDDLEEQAISIFEQLQGAQDVYEEDGRAYQELLQDINQFIEDLQDYRTISVAEGDFRILIENLRSDTDVLLGEEGAWKRQWAGRLDELKTKIAVLPVYTSTESRETQDLSGQISYAPGDAGMEKLLRYDRAEASDELDEMLRLYIADHNAVQQGLIYLGSPYKGLAIFSIILAFALDIVAFITGLIIEARENGRITEEKKEEEKEEEEEAEWETREEKVKRKKKENKREEKSWLGEFINALLSEKELRHYIYLSSDYVCMEGKNTYRAIENGNETEISLSKAGLAAGIYVEHDREFLPVSTQQEIQFVNDPKDGIYQDCRLRYEDYALSIMEKGEKEYRFLANIVNNIPVYKLSKNKLDVVSVEALKGDKVKMAVIALNKKGTIVIAVYLCDRTFTENAEEDSYKIEMKDELTESLTDKSREVEKWTNSTK